MLTVYYTLQLLGWVDVKSLSVLYVAAVHRIASTSERLAAVWTTWKWKDNAGKDAIYTQC